MNSIESNSLRTCRINLISTDVFVRQKTFQNFPSRFIVCSKIIRIISIKLSTATKFYPADTEKETTQNY